MDEQLEVTLRRRRPWRIAAIVVIAVLAILTFAQILTRIG